MDVSSQLSRGYIFDTKVVELMLQRDYALTAVSMESLDGYDDKNYHVIVEPEHNNQHIKEVCSSGYLVKIINASDSKLYDFTWGRKLLNDHINMHGIRCQEEVKNVNGEFFSYITANINGEAIRHMVSVRTFIPGVVLHEIALTTKLLYDVGLLAAKICKSLQSFHFEFYDNFTPLWAMENFLKLKSVLHVVNDVKKRHLVEDILETFEGRVIPRKAEFSKGPLLWQTYNPWERDAARGKRSKIGVLF